MKNIQENINKIDKILQNEELFEIYVNQIEEKDIKVNKKLKDKIFNKINNKKKISAINVLKIAACTLLVIIISETDLYKSAECGKLEVDNSMYDTIKMKVDNVSNMMLSPIVFERGEN